MDPVALGIVATGYNGIERKQAMSFEISRETQARLLAVARREGVSVDELLTRLIERAPTRRDPATTELPLWHLGGSGPLHRRDIYLDAV